MVSHWRDTEARKGREDPFEIVGTMKLEGINGVINLPCDKVREQYLSLWFKYFDRLSDAQLIELYEQLRLRKTVVLEWL